MNRRDNVRRHFHLFQSQIRANVSTIERFFNALSRRCFSYETHMHLDIHIHILHTLQHCRKSSFVRDFGTVSADSRGWSANANSSLSHLTRSLPPSRYHRCAHNFSHSNPKMLCIHNLIEFSYRVSCFILPIFFCSGWFSCTKHGKPSGIRHGGVGIYQQCLFCVCTIWRCYCLDCGSIVVAFVNFTTLTTVSIFFSNASSFATESLNSNASMLQRVAT